MRAFVSGILLLFVVNLAGQSAEWHSWYFGNRLGMQFNNGVRTIVTDSEFGANYGAASIGSPSDGSFLMATDGMRIYTKDFVQLNEAVAATTPIFSLFVPDPVKALNYYLFVVDNSDVIHFVHIDHSLANPKVDQTSQVLRMNADHHFSVVKRLYGEGYWLITHTRGTNEFISYLITEDGIDSQPVVSNAGTVTSADNKFVYGNIVSDKKGETLLHCFVRMGQNPVAELLHFDKKCGIVSSKKTLKLTATDFCCQGAFSMNDQFIYVACGGVYQYDANGTGQVLNGVPVPGSIQASPKIALAPDGIIYLSRADAGVVTSKVCTIEQANTANPEFFYDKVNLSPTSTLRYVENFPAFIMDWSVPGQDPNYPLPVLFAENTCLGDSTSFEARENFLYDSLSWDFGDGSKSALRNPKHRYSSAAAYSVILSWYVCGRKHNRSLNIVIGEIPEFSLGADSLLCAGTNYFLEGPDNAASYKWNDGLGTKSRMITTKGLYWLEVGNGTCFRRDSVTLDFLPDILIALGTGHHLCPEDSTLVRLDAGKGFDTYRWTPTGDSTQWIDVVKEGDYFVVVQDFNGCKGDGGTFVERRCPVYLELPNAFSPNTDGFNDVFQPVSLDVVEMELKIFDRWGALIYTLNSPEASWDGTYKGEAVSDGVYMIVLRYTGYEKGLLKQFNRKQVLHVIH